MKNYLSHWFRFVLGLILFASVIFPAGAVQGEQAHAVPLTLAGVQVELDLPFPTGQFIQADADDALQVATATVMDPFFEISLAAEQIAGSRAAALRSLRASQSGTTLPARQMRFFGRLVSSQSNQVMLNLWTSGVEAVVVHEWVVEENNLTWTFRVSYAADSAFDPAVLDNIILSVVGHAPVQTVVLPAPPAEPELSAADALPTPTWWGGDCDTNTYKEKSGLNAYALGGSYRGVKACGPRPWYDSAPDVLVRFYSGAWGEYEWECVELSMRYLYLAYGIAPYPGNGKDVVTNYPGSLLSRVSNGTIHLAPQPGDVLSYGPTTTYGHTSVVSASSVDASGNGSITVIEQNSSATGSKTLVVSNWVVQASMTVSGWLHYPTSAASKPYRFFIPAVSRP